MVDYEFGGRVLDQSEQERDHGVIMHKSGKSTIQCAEATKRAHGVLGNSTRGCGCKLYRKVTGTKIITLAPE